jgi:hypothetical protein
MAIQTDICGLLGIPSSSTEEEITDAYVEILQNELSGEALVPRERFSEVYRTYQEWANWKKQSLALVKVLQEESLKGRSVPRNEFEDFYKAYQEWNNLKKQDPLLLDTSEPDRPSLVIRLSATQAILALIPVSAVAIGILWGGSILIYQRNRQEPTVVAETPVNKSAQAVPKNQTVVSPTTINSVADNSVAEPAVTPPTPKPIPTSTKPAAPIKQTASSKPVPVALQKPAAPIPVASVSNVSIGKIPALPVMKQVPAPTAIKPVPQRSLPSLPQLPAPPRVSAAPALKPTPVQTTPNPNSNVVGSYESPVGSKPGSAEAPEKSTENALQALQAISIELENGSTIPASQLLKLNLSQDPQKARKLSKFLKELETSQDVAQARLISEITIPQLQELAKEAKSLP